MNLRLDDALAAKLRRYADQHGTSMQEAAKEGIRRLVESEERDAIIHQILDRDAELLDRLAQ